jgi:anti-sigma factor RsiW
MPPLEDDLPCAVFVEMITDYLDGAIPADLRARVEAHLAICPGCLSVLAQIEQVIALAGRLGEDDVEALPDADREQLVAAFRAARSDGVQTPPTS